jgi:hypothetical protein
MKAYHFVGAELRDGRPVPPDGEWLVHAGPVELCASGLHASRHPFDALRYAAGATLCLVDVEDVVEEDTDKLVCRRRMIVRRIDATELLWGFARWCALQVIHLWDAPDVVRRYLETGDESLRAAAWASAWAAAWGSARDDAGAWGSARAAARDARAAARSAAWDAQRDEFARLVDEAFDAAGKEA